MAMNRQARRMAQKQGYLDEDGEQIAQKRQQPQPQGPAEERTPPGEFIKEVRSEMKKVAWPNRDEVINYSLIVLAVVVLLTAFIAALDYAFGEGILALFGR